MLRGLRPLRMLDAACARRLRAVALRGTQGEGEMENMFRIYAVILEVLRLLRPVVTELEGALYAATPRLDWASLLRRSFDVDVLRCVKCGGRLRVLSVITEREPVQRILAHLGVPTEAPPVARARDPTDDVDEVEPPGQLGLGLA